MQLKYSFPTQTCADTKKGFVQASDDRSPTSDSDTDGSPAPEALWAFGLGKASF